MGLRRLENKAEAEDFLRNVRSAANLASLGRVPDRNCVVWPAEYDRGLMLEARLGTREFNGLFNAGLLTGTGEIRVGDIISRRNIGVKSLATVLWAIEEILREST